MSIKALKTHLVTKPEKELLQEIVKLYQQFSVVRDFYDSQISAEGANDVLSKYKKIIQDEFLPKHDLAMQGYLSHEKRLWTLKSLMD